MILSAARRATISISTATDFLYTVFLDIRSGYVAAGLGKRTKDGHHTLGEHRFFNLKTEWDDLLRWCEGHAQMDVYFSVAAFSKPARSAADDEAVSRVVYADADSFDPGDFRLAPSIRVETSPGNWHAYWVLDRTYNQHEVSAVARKISKAHNLDASSGITTKLLRVPGTTNTKYDLPFNVEATITDDVYTLGEIDATYADVQVVEPGVVQDVPMPENLPDNFDVLDLLPANHSRLEYLLTWDKATSEEPHMRSERRYELARLLLELGLDPEQALVVVWHSKLADHYREQGRGIGDVWRFDILPALAKQPQQVDLEPINSGAFTYGNDFLTQAEVEAVFSEPGFVDRWEEMNYKGLHPKTPSQYIRLNGYMYLAACLGHEVQVMPPSTSRGVFCNVYAMNNGETTSGKSEALFFLKRYIRAYETKYAGYDILIGSNATAEGLVKALKDYDERTAMITTEEVSGKFRQWQNSSAMAHAREAELELYDNYLPKNLRAGDGNGNTKNVHIAFSQYMMGVDSEVESILDRGFLRSGYLPRCVIVKGTRSAFDEAELLSVEQGDPRKTQDIDPEPERWADSLDRSVRGNKRYMVEKRRIMQFDADAWARFLEFRADILKYAETHEDPDVVRPMAIRFAISCQKFMALLAFERTVERVQMIDVLHVLQDAELWWRWAMDMVQAVQESAFARLQADVLGWLQSQGGRVRQSAFHAKFASLPMRERTDVLESLKRRNVVAEKKSEKGIPMLEASQ